MIWIERLRSHCSLEAIIRVPLKLNNRDFSIGNDGNYICSHFKSGWSNVVILWIFTRIIESNSTPFSIHLHAFSKGKVILTPGHSSIKNDFFIKVSFHRIFVIPYKCHTKQHFNATKYQSLTQITHHTVLICFSLTDHWSLLQIRIWLLNMGIIKAILKHMDGFHVSY